LKLIEQQQPSPDFYFVNVKATPKASGDKAAAPVQFFLVESRFEVKVTTVIALADVNVGVADRDQSNPKLYK
jgi:hypothetical protein